MRNIFSSLLLLCFVCIFCSGTHPIYVSVTEMELNAKDQRLEVSCKLFTDDFEKVLRNTYKVHVDLYNPGNRAEMDKLVSGYVQAHLKLTADGKPLTLKYLGYEIIEEGVYSYYEVPGIASLKRLDIFNNLFYEYSQQQMGLMHLTVKGERKSTKLVNPDSKASLVF